MQQPMDTSWPTDLPLPAIICAVGFVCLLAAGVIADFFLAIRLRVRRPRWGRRFLRLMARPWSWREALIMLLVLAGMYALLGTCAGILERRSRITEAGLRTLGILTETIVINGVTIGMIALFIRRRGASWRQAFGFRRGRLAGDIGRGILLYFATIPVLVLLSLAYMAFLSAIGFPLDPQPAVQLLHDPSLPPWMRVHLVLAAAVAAPWVEELAFRGIALPVLGRRFGPAPAIAAVALFFAVLHMHVPSIVPLFVMSTAFSLAYVYTGTVAVPIVMHTLFNAGSLIALFLLKDVPELGPF
jgi:membrane protease YdiL (CAAX protease family)